MNHERSSESGQGIVLLALALVILLAFVALAVDVGFAYVRAVQFSAAVDSAALAGTIDLEPASDSTYEADIRAVQFLGANGWPTPTMKSMSSSRSVTKLGLPNYTLTATWPVDFFFARVIGLNDYSVTRKATATYFAQAELWTPSASEYGHIRTASQFILGPDGCSQQGEPVSTPLSAPRVANNYYPMFDRTYGYQIVVDGNYVASDILRIELFDPDSFNSRSDSSVIRHSLSDGRADEELSCSGVTEGEGDVCILDDLEVKHAHTEEIGAALESVLEAVLRLNRSGRKRLVGDPRLLEAFHEGDGFFGFSAPDVVPLGLGLGRPVVCVMQCLHPEVGPVTSFHTSLYRM